LAYNDFIEKPQSQKITVVEIDSPLSVTWLNLQPGIWYAYLTPGIETFEDDFGNTGYWGPSSAQYYNIQSLNVDGTLYSEVASIVLTVATEKTWFYDTDTTFLYVHFEDWNPPEVYTITSPGAAIGFTFQKDRESNNYFEDIYYNSSVISIPNLSKKKDPLFFGVIQYQGGSITFQNEDGYFDDFATRDLYGQPVRIKYTFEGLDISEQVTVYSGRVEDFTHDLRTFKLQVADLRKLLTRKLPVNTLSLTTYPDMDSKLDGTPIPIAFGDIINAPAYKVTDTSGTETFVFCDTEYNAVDSGISVVDKDGAAVVTAGTETDGTFTTTSSEDKLYVTFSQTTVENGLDIITDILENYEGIAFNSNNYDVNEWSSEKGGVKNSGIWLGKGNLKSSVDIIEQICIDNSGIFDVLADGRFTFKTLNADKVPTYEIYQDELLNDASIAYPSKEYLSSVKAEYSKDWLEKESELYTNLDFEDEVYARYRQYKENTYKTTLTSETDAISLTNDIMNQSKQITPTVTLTTKTQNIGVAILDNVMFEYKRQNGNVIIPRSRWQVLGSTLNMTAFTVQLIIKQIREDDGMYLIIDGGDSTTDYDYYDGGSSTTTPDDTIDGGDAG
jgi:hypothetical protein